MVGYAALDYEIDSRNGRVLASLGGEIRLEYEQMSPSRAEIVCPEPPDLPPLSRLTIYHNSEQGRVPVWRGWLMSVRHSRQGAVLTFLGAREILRFAPIQAIFFRPIAIGKAFRLIIWAVIAELQDIDLSDWRISPDCGTLMQMVDLRDVGDAAEAIRRLEDLAPGWRATFAFGSDGYFWARMLQKPSMGEILCPGDIMEYEEDYGGIANRLQILMAAPEAVNLVPNGDFSRPIPLESAATNLVPNPSFEESNHGNHWDLPDPPFYYEWAPNRGYTGYWSFKFHDCAEYSSTAWLTSGRFFVTANYPYAGGFAYGCDPKLAEECGGPSTVKLKYEIRGYNIDGNYTETPAQGEIAGDFHADYHWHWVDIPPFIFSNPFTARAEIRFLTYHGKRLYLDEVQVHPYISPGQEGWQVTTSGGASAVVGWFQPEGPYKRHNIAIQIDAGSGQEVRLEQEPNSVTTFKPNHTLYFQIWFDYPAPQLDVEWLNSSGNVISTQNINLTTSFYENDGYIDWYQAKGSALSPAGAVALRLILKWSNVQGMTLIRAVSVSYMERAIAPAYGYSPSAIYDAGTISYPPEADAEFAAEAQGSPSTFGHLPAILIRDDISSDAIAEEFARWYFLRRAIPARTIRIAGASIDDVRILQPQFYRWRIPIGGTSRRFIVERLIIRHDGSWEAECGEYLPDASQLLAAIYKRKISG